MSLFDELIELLLPQRCAGCGDAPDLLCGTCAARLLTPARPVSRSVHRPVHRPLAFSSPPASPPRRSVPYRFVSRPSVPTTWTITTYEGPVRAILAAYKERGRTALAAPLGAALARAADAALTSTPSGIPPRSPPNRSGDRWPVAPGRTAADGTGPGRWGRRGEPGGNAVMIVGVPSGRRAVRRRGHDALRELVDVAVRLLRADGLNVVRADALRQRRRIDDQAGLTARERAENVAGALEVVPRTAVAGRSVVVADDVITTGATLAEAVRALRAAGAEVVGGATVAETARRHPT